LARSPHCWALPYVEALLELSELEKIMLGFIICAISDEFILARLTNLDNFFPCVGETLTRAFSPSRQVPFSDLEKQALGKLVEGLFGFTTARAWPTIMAAGDHSYQHLYITLARGLIAASFAVANQLLGREETPTTRRQALEGLEIARAALGIAPSQGDLEYLDRNATLLRAGDVMNPIELAQLYRANLAAMAPYADAKAFTGAIQDLLFASAKREAPQMLETLLALLADAPRDLVRCEAFIDQVLIALIDLSKASDANQAAMASRLTIPFCAFFADRLRQTEDADAAEEIAQLSLLGMNLARGSEGLEQVSRLFTDLNKMLTEESCGALFVTAVLKGAQAAQRVLKTRQGQAGSLVGFNTTFTVFSRERLRELVRDDAERANLGQLNALTLAVTDHVVAGGERYVHMGCFVDLKVNDVREAASGQAFGQILCERLLGRYAKSPGITGPEAQSSD
jgi:hypothetical protein